MAEKVLINLATGLEDRERVTVAFLVAGAALEANARRAGATPMWEWLGEGGTAFSY